MYKKTVLFGLILALVLSLGSLFLPSDFLVSAESVNDFAYVVNSYDFVIDVNLDNTYEITETITATFASESLHGESHGLYFYIPNQITALYHINGKKHYYRYGIDIDLKSAREVTSNTQADEVFEEDGNLIIIIREDQKVNGLTRVYELKYSYGIGYDRINTFDSFYFNLLTTKVQTLVNTLTYTINFPYELTQENGYNGLEVYIDPVSSYTTATDSHYITGSTLHGTISGVLRPNNSVTILALFDEGYFSEVKKFSIGTDISLTVMTLLILAYIVYTYNTKRNTKSIVQTVEFYPPNNIDPVQLSYVLNGYITPKSLTPLLIYWASKGYIKIIEDDKKDISIQKIKDLGSEFSKYQVDFFNAIFASGKKQKVSDDLIENVISKVKNLNAKQDDSIKDKPKEQIDEHPVIKVDSLSGKLGTTVTESVSLARYEFGARIEKSSIKNSIIIRLLGIVPLIAFILFYSLRLNILSDLVALVPALILYVVFTITTAVVFTNTNYVKPKVKNWFSVITVALVVGIIFLIAYVYNEPVIDMLYLKYTSFATLIVSLVLSNKILSLNNEYRELYGKSLGFRKHLLLTEKARIEMLVKDDPTYFYDILPYAYAMNITDKYVKHFEGITLEQPTWYETSNRVTVFDVIVFHHIMNHSFNTFSKNITIMSTASKLGGGYGGKFGGGGLGGGGIGGFGGGGFGGTGMGRV